MTLNEKIDLAFMAFFQVVGLITIGYVIGLLLRRLAKWRRNK